MQVSFQLQTMQMILTITFGFIQNAWFLQLQRILEEIQEWAELSAEEDYGRAIPSPPRKNLMLQPWMRKCIAYTAGTVEQQHEIRLWH